jgi:glycosyltransferase 2 family protein
MSARRTILFLGALLGACFLYLALDSLDWAALAAQLRRFQWLYLVPILVALLGYFAVKAKRWECLLRPLARASAEKLLRPVVAGIAGNYLLPHAGDVARSLLAGRKLHLPLTALLATVVIERVFDFLALLVITVVIMIPAGQLSPEIRIACWSVGFFCAVVLAFIVGFLAHKDACLRLAGRLMARAPTRTRERVMHQLRAAADGLGAIARPRLLLPVLFLSILQWLLILACVALSLRSIGVSFTLVAASSVLLLNVIGLTLPAAPGHLGTVQLAFVIGLAPFGVPQTDAIAGSLIYNVATVVPALLLGAKGLRDAWRILHRRLTR